MPNILVATLGTWALVPEIIGFTNPDIVDLYRYHPHADQIARSRIDHAINPCHEVWLITTDASFVQEQIDLVMQWYTLLNRPHPLRIWRVAGTQNLSSLSECRLMTEAIFRLTLLAREKTTGSQLLLSLAGGRKTMSADLQRAASAFGCHGLLHVIQNDNDKDLKNKVGSLAPKQLTEPLPADYRDAFTPLILGRLLPNPAVLQATDDSGQITGADYPLPWASDQADILLCRTEPWLVDQIEQRIECSAYLLCNHSNRMAGEHSANFMALYGLAPETIDQFKNERIGIDPDKGQRDLAWLRLLPKADLHCHLGGVLDAADMIRVALANAELVERHKERLAPALGRWRRMIDRGDASLVRQKINFKGLRQAVAGVPEPACVSAFLMLFEHDPYFLDQVVYGPYRTEAAYCKISFKEYETLGDLQGSGLLQSIESIKETCRILVEKARQDNIHCLELRCSPHNYTRGGLDAVAVVEIISKALENSGFAFGITLTAGRHRNRSEIRKVIDLAKKLISLGPTAAKAVRAVDLAGDEQARPAERLRKDFLPLMKECVHLTIHAGETVSAESIWEAVYHLSAERIGHGLTLAQNTSLMDKFRDRDIAIEMCPSSNFQIKGFCDHFIETSRLLGSYPLKTYLDAGLRVTVNTDNPGISRTNLSNELLRAARMTKGGLSRWEILQLIRNGFKASFLERSVKHGLLREAEKQIIAIIEQEEARGHGKTRVGP